MFVNVDGKVYDVRFGRQRVEVPEHVKRKDVFNTFCKVSMVNDTKKGRDRFQEVALGEARQSVKDRYNKIVGKKIAMRRAVKGFSRDKRKIFWETFLDNFDV